MKHETRALQNSTLFLPWKALDFSVSQHGKSYDHTSACIFRFLHLLTVHLLLKNKQTKKKTMQGSNFTVNC